MGLNESKSATRFDSYASIHGKNWLIGSHLLPLLDAWGRNVTGPVLDLGCGQSPFRRFFPKAVPYLRIDRSQEDSEVMLGDLRRIPLADGSVNVVLLFQALTDVPDPSTCLREIGRVLREGGSLIVLESMCYPEHDLPNDYYRIMPEGLVYLADQSGFVLSDLVRLGGIFTRFGGLWNLMMSRIGYYPAGVPVSVAGTIMGNLLFRLLDRLFCYPRFASDYCARLIKK